MGNRAVITTNKVYEPTTSQQLGVYLHWNGGRDSVEAFLAYCKLKGYRPPEQDCYGWARLCQVIGNFFGGGLSLGIEKCCNLDCDNYDNGVYLIENWEIVDRKYHNGPEQQSYDLDRMLIEIDKAQPAKEQLGDFLKAKEVSIDQLDIGDVVYVFDTISNKYEPLAIEGFGENKVINGKDVYLVPYVGKYGDAERGYAWNVNNYIFADTVRLVPSEIHDNDKNERGWF